MFQPAGVRTLLQMRTSYPARPSTSAGLPEFLACGRAGDARPCTAPPQISLLASPSHESWDADCEEWWEYADPQSLIHRATSMISELQHGWVRERRHRLNELCRDMEEQYSIRLSDSERDAVLKGSTGDMVHGLMPHDVHRLGEANRALTDAAEQVMKDAKEQFEASRGLRQRLQEVTPDGVLEDRCTDLEESEPSCYLDSLQEEVTRLRAAQHVRNELCVCTAARVPSEGDDMVPTAAQHLSAFDAWVNRLHPVDTVEKPAEEVIIDGTAGISAALAPSASICTGVTESHLGRHATGIMLSDPDSHAFCTRWGEDASCSVGDVQKQLDEILSEFDEIDRIRDDICKITLT